MKLDALREELKREPKKPKKRAKKAQPSLQVRTTIRQWPLSLLRQPCPECGRKRRLRARNGYLVEIACWRCGILWRVSPHSCCECKARPVSFDDRMCGDCMARILPPMHYPCRSS
jgi:hypothetical protein